MKYVLPIPRELRGRLNEFSRLYAYPTKPEPPPVGGFVIMDSGAFGLSQRGGSIDAPYMRKLSSHYREHGASNIFPVIAVAPDEFLNPHRTMQNWTFWHNESMGRIAPVIQFKKTKQIDLFAVLNQAEFYRDFDTPFVCVSNPSLHGIEALDSPIWRVFDFVRNKMDAMWIHVLGAGWSPECIAAWRKVGGFDSMDSVAYYSAAQQQTSWIGPPCDHWTSTAVSNAQYTLRYG